MVIAAESGGETTDYLYGLERIAALNGKNKIEYAYDGRGSVAAELRYTDAWYTLGGALSNAYVTSKSYTPFGEQMGEALSGFGYNGEYYNANTGMIYLRARFYEPEMNRFSQKDIVRGGITVPNSLNRYTYVQNDPLNLIDPSGESLKSAWNSAKTAVKSVASQVRNATKKVMKTAYSTAKAATSVVKTAVRSAAVNIAASFATGTLYSPKQTMNNISTAVKNGAMDVRNAINAASGVVSAGVREITDTVNATKEGIKNTLELSKNIIGNDLMGPVSVYLRIQSLISSKLPAKSKPLYEENYTYNSQRDIVNTIINDQWYGDMTGVSDLNFGLTKMRDTGCEVIAVNNAMVQIGHEASIADLVRQFETMNGLTKAPFIKEGEFGGNPYSIGRVLDANGINYTEVDIAKMADNPGTYIMSIYNIDRETGIPSAFSGLHTVALSVNENGSIDILNLLELGDPTHIDNYAIFTEQFENRFITGYKVG